MNNLERCTKNIENCAHLKGICLDVVEWPQSTFRRSQKEVIFCGWQGGPTKLFIMIWEKREKWWFPESWGHPYDKIHFWDWDKPMKKKSSVFGVSPWKAPMLHSPSWSCLIPIDGIKHDKPFTSICEYLIYLWFTAQCISLPLTTNGASERCPCHSPDHLGQEDIQLNSHGANFRWIRGTRIGNFQVLYCSYLRLVNVAFSMSIYVIDIWLRLVSSMRSPNLFSEPAS